MGSSCRWMAVGLLAMCVIGSIGSLVHWLVKLMNLIHSVNLLGIVKSQSSSESGGDFYAYLREIEIG